MKYLLATCATSTALGLGMLGGEREGSLSDPPPRSAPFVGVTVPSRRAAIAPEQDGTIVEMPVAEGDAVVPGQVLFQLNSLLLELEVERLEALATTDLLVQKTRAGLQHARQREQRLRILAHHDIASTSALEERQAEVEIAELQLQIVEFDQVQARNQWLQARQRLTERTLRSPIPGIVAKKHRQPGETAERLLPVLEVITLDPLWVEFECPVEQKDVFRRGAEVSVTPTSDPSAPRTAVIVYVSMEANPSTHTFLARAAIANPDHTWRAGLKTWVRASHDEPPPAEWTPAKPGGR